MQHNSQQIGVSTSLTAQVPLVPTTYGTLNAIGLPSNILPQQQQNQQQQQQHVHHQQQQHEQQPQVNTNTTMQGQVSGTQMQNWLTSIHTLQQQQPNQVNMQQSGMSIPTVRMNMQGNASIGVPMTMPMGVQMATPMNGLANTVGVGQNTVNGTSTSTNTRNGANSNGAQQGVGNNNSSNSNGVVTDVPGTRPVLRSPWASTVLVKRTLSQTEGSAGGAQAKHVETLTGGEGLMGDLLASALATAPQGESSIATTDTVAALLRSNRNMLRMLFALHEQRRRNSGVEGSVATAGGAAARVVHERLHANLAYLALVLHATEDAEDGVPVHVAAPVPPLEPPSPPPGAETAAKRHVW